VRTPPAWSPDGRSVYYAKLTRHNPHWSLQFDLYRYDLAEEEETRITSGRRAQSPSVSPDGARIVFVTVSDGTANLAVVDRDGNNYRQITSFAEGEQAYNPRWSAAGDMIVFDYSERSGRDIAAIVPDGTGFGSLSGAMMTPAARRCRRTDRAWCTALTGRASSICTRSTSRVATLINSPMSPGGRSILR